MAKMPPPGFNILSGFNFWNAAGEIAAKQKADAREAEADQLRRLGWNDHVIDQLQADSNNQDIIDDVLKRQTLYKNFDPSFLHDRGLGTADYGSLVADDPYAVVDPVQRDQLNQLAEAGVYAGDPEDRAAIDVALGREPTVDAGEAAAEDFGGSDYNQLRYEDWRKEFDPLAGEKVELAGKRRTELDELASSYADDLLGNPQLEALRGTVGDLRGIYDAGGLTDVTKANLEAARRAEDQWIRAQREAMLDDLTERGVAGGGIEVASSAADRAAAADRMSARDLETNAFAQEQALQALKDSAGLSGDIFGIEQGIADTKMGLELEGGDLLYETANGLVSDAMNTWNEITKSNRDFVDEAGLTTARQVLPASESAVRTITGASEGARSNVAGAAGGMAGEDVAYGEGLTNLAGTPPTPANTIVPLAPTQPSAGPVLDMVGGTGGAIVSDLINQRPWEQKPAAATAAKPAAADDEEAVNG